MVATLVSRNANEATDGVKMCYRVIQFIRTFYKCRILMRYAKIMLQSNVLLINIKRFIPVNIFLMLKYPSIRLFSLLTP
jgi:hypothetical protein